MYQSRLDSQRGWSLYELLQVSPRAEPDVIHAAYRALARSCHPDINRDPNAAGLMRQLNAAYDVLSDPERRAQYDAQCARFARTLGSRRTVRMPHGDHGAGRVALPVERGHVSPVARAVFSVLLLVLTLIMMFAVWFVHDVLEDQPPHTFQPHGSLPQFTAHVPWWSPPGRPRPMRPAVDAGPVDRLAGALPHPADERMTHS